MANTLTFRWHSRAGQGAITASNALAEILGDSGKLVQSFPEFGAEKRGAPVAVFNRISEQKITDVSHPTELDIAILLDTTLISSCEITALEVLEGLKEEGKLLVNTAQKELLMAKGLKHVFVLDASEISLKEIGMDIPNVPILGALVKISELSDLKDFLPKLEDYLARGLPEKIVAGNLKAFERGFKEVEKI